MSIYVFPRKVKIKNQLHVALRGIHLRDWNIPLMALIVMGISSKSVVCGAWNFVIVSSLSCYLNMGLTV